MLTIKPIKSAADASKYYSAKDNYYLTDKGELEHATRWYGLGATALGLEGKVCPNTFLHLLEGRLPSGQQLGKRDEQGKIKHRPGTDITLSAPKSVSLMALVGGDKRLLDAHNDAVSVTFEAIEQLAAEARITINGETGFEKTKNLVVALFQHTTSRELDALLHDHGVIMNMTERSDGKWRALSSRSKNDKEHLDNGFRELIYNNQHYLGLIYNSSLAKTVCDIGFDIEIKDRYGNFEIVGLSEDYLKHSSKRRSNIVNRMNETGFFSSKAAEKANLDTRKVKGDIDTQALKALWSQEAKDFGVDFEALIDASKSNKKGQITNRESVTASATAREALDDALTQLSPYSTQIRHGDLVRMAFTFARGQINHDELEQEISERYSDKRLEGKASVYYTTKAQVMQEHDFVKQFKGTRETGFSIETGSSGLASEMLRSEDRVQLIDVNGLSHEGELITEMVHASEANGLRTYVLHVGQLQTKYLSNSVTRDSSTLWKKLKNCIKADLVQTVSGFQARYEQRVEKPTKRQDVVIVHDAQKLSYKELMSLESLTNKSQSKLILLNNTNSTEGFCAGSPIKALKEAGFKACVSATREKKLSFELVQTKKAFEDLAKHYAQLPVNEREATQIAALTSKDEAELTALVRARLKNEGIISLQSKDVRVLSCTTLSEVQKKHSKFYDKGDQITFNAYTREQSHFRVIGKEGGSIEIENQQGLRKLLKPEEDAQFIVTKTKPINLSIGDPLVAERSIYLGRAGKLERGTTFCVSAIDEKGVTLVSPKITLNYSNEELEDLALSYSYVRKPGQITTKPKHILVAADGYQVNKNTMGELGELCSDIRLFTSDKQHAQAALEKQKIYFSIDNVAKGAPCLVYRDSQFSDSVIRKDLEFLSDILSKNEPTVDAQSIASVAVAYASAKLSEREAAFKHKELVTEAMVFAMGKSKIKDIEQAIEKKEAAGDLIHADTFWVSKESLAIERSILEHNTLGQNTLEPISTNQRLLSLPETLTQGQKDAISLSVTTRDCFTTVQGLAGVGKTTMMREIQTIANEEGFRVLGLAPMHTSKDEMIANGLEAMTVAQFLTHDTPYDNKTLFIVDEVSMIGNQDYLSLQKKIKQTGGRANLVGDMTQLQSPSSGKPHELTVKTQTQKTAFMEEIMRQNPNPELKKAVIHATKGNIKESFETLEGINPEEWIKRGVDLPFKKSSVIEVDCFCKKNKTQDYNVIYKALANDYLTRIDEHQKNTLIIAHTHEDRAQLNALIREGLQKQGKISLDEVPTTRFARRSIEKAGLLSVLSYKEGDILRFDANYSVAKKGEYFRVDSIDKEQRRLHCKDSQGHEFSINPAAIAIKSRMSVYEEVTASLATGDRIRLRLTDKKRGHMANTEYTVQHVTKDKAILQNEEGSIDLALDKNKDAHWDYSYTTTAFGAQGATSLFVIALELAKRQQATSHRANKIDVTRPKAQVSVYTENKTALIERLERFDGDKNSAHLTLEAASEKEKKRGLNIKNDLSVPKEPKERAGLKVSGQQHYKQPKVSAEELNQQLIQHMETLAVTLLGDHNHSLKNGNNIRYGTKGSLSINLNTGLWFNFESGEKGNALQLISAQNGYVDFKDTLAFARDFLNYKDDIQPLHPVKEISEKKTLKVSGNKKEYAMKLYKESLPIKGTLAERYLNNIRKVTVPRSADLRFLPKIKTIHKDKQTSTPALLCVARDVEGKVNHVQVIRLDSMTGDKDYQSDIIKQTYGLVNGCTVVLNDVKSKKTYLTEGTETGLSLLKADSDVRVETVLGKSNFIHVNPDKLSKEVVICVDNDGDKTFDDLVVVKSVQRLIAAGKTVSLICPEQRGEDLNSVLINEGSEKVKGYMEKAVQVNKVFKSYEQSNSIATISGNENDVLKAKSLLLKKEFFQTNPDSGQIKSTIKAIEHQESEQFKNISAQQRNRDLLMAQQQLKQPINMPNRAQKTMEMER